MFSLKIYTPLTRTIYSSMGADCDGGKKSGGVSSSPYENSSVACSSRNLTATHSNQAGVRWGLCLLRRRRTCLSFSMLASGGVISSTRANAIQKFDTFAGSWDMEYIGQHRLDSTTVNEMRFGGSNSSTREE